MNFVAQLDFALAEADTDFAGCSDCHVDNLESFGILSDFVAAQNFVADKRIDNAAFQIFQRGLVIAVSSEFRKRVFKRRVVDDISFGRGAGLRADFFARQVAFGSDALRVAFLHQNNLTIVHVGLAVKDVALAFGRDVQAVPNDVDFAGSQFAFLVVPINRLELEFDAQTFCRLRGKVNVKADNFAALVAETHRLVFVVKPDNINFVAVVA